MVVMIGLHASKLDLFCTSDEGRGANIYGVRCHGIFPSPFIYMH